MVIAVTSGEGEEGVALGLVVTGGGTWNVLIFSKGEQILV